ncbi:MAG: hypothetical protein ACT4QD_11690 [Acidobacteriota bacterium]
MSLKEFLKRGALVVAANWHVVLVQFIADALFKTLLVVPLVGGVFLGVLLIGGRPAELLALPAGEIVSTMTSVLLEQPMALAAFLLALAVVIGGGSLLMFLIKGGTVSVLVAAERAAGAIERPPLRHHAFRRAVQFSLERFTTGATSLFPRYVRLGLGLMVFYSLATMASIGLVFGGGPDADLRLWAVLASLVLVGCITIANAFYLLCQVVIAADDCAVREAVARVARLLQRQGGAVSLIFGATLGLVVATTGASILATAALGLIAFVPLVGLAALPLQLIAWLVRGVVFQYIGLTALVAYTGVYRGLKEDTRTADHDVPHIERSA